MIKNIFNSPIGPATFSQRLALATSLAIVFWLVRERIFDPLHIQIIPKALLNAVIAGAIYFLFEYNWRIRRIEARIQEIMDKLGSSTPPSELTTAGQANFDVEPATKRES